MFALITSEHSCSSSAILTTKNFRQVRKTAVFLNMCEHDDINKRRYLEQNNIFVTFKHLDMHFLIL